MLCTTYRKPLVTVGAKMRGSEVTCTISGDRRQPMSCTTYRKPLVTVATKMRGSEVTCTISGDRR